VVYHAAQPYESNAWIVTDHESVAPIAWLAFALHQFRMPGFFMLSGFLGALAYRKYGAGAFLSRRLVRLGVPLLTGLLVINVAQSALIAWLQTTHCSHNGPCSIRTSHTQLSVSHLWFLIYLLAFVVALPAAVEFLRRCIAQLPWRSKPRSAADSRASTGWVPPVAGGLATLVLFGAALHAIAHWAPVLYQLWWGFLVPYDALQMFGWFALGMACGVDTRQADAWFRNRLPLRPALASVVVGLTICVLLTHFTETAGSLLNLGAEAAETAGIGMLLFGAVHLLGGLYEASPEFFSKVSDASYTIYLVHHPIVIALAGLLLDVKISPYLKFGLIVTVTSSTSYLFHTLFVARFKWTRLLFNGAR
jgi:glucan biosynthesis protein C